LFPDSFWFQPLDYAGDRPGALDFDTSDHLPNNQELHDRPEEREVFQLGQTVFFWVNLHGIDSSDSLEFRWHFNNTVTSQPRAGGNIHYSWLLSSFDASTAGEGQVELLVNNVPVASDTFHVVAQPADEPAGTFEFSAPVYTITENG